jgi:hypothetical protein
MPPQAARDAYGFELDCSAAQLAARGRCDAKQEQQAAKWAKYEARGGQLPSGEKLKNLCRKVHPALTLAALLYPSARARRPRFSPPACLACKSASLASALQYHHRTAAVCPAGSVPCSADVWWPTAVTMAGY